MEKYRQANKQKHTSKALKTFTDTRDGPVLTWRKGHIRLLSRAGPAPPGTGDEKTHFFRWANGPPSGPFQTIKSDTEHKNKTQEEISMKTINNKSSGVKQFLTALLSLAMLAAILPGNALATNTVEFAQISNTATVSWADGAANAFSTTATVNVQVTFLAAAPLLDAPIDITTDASTAAVYTYTITNQANGEDTYNLAVDSITESAGITGGTSTAVLSVASVTLGASTVISVAGSVITVPSDNDCGDGGAVNGIFDNDTLMIGGNPYTVAVGGIGDGNCGTFGSTATITLTAAPGALALGTPIQEYTTFTLTVTPGTVTNGSVNQTIDVQISAQDSGAVFAATTDTTQTIVSAFVLTVVKYVRNVLNAAGNAGGAGALPINGSTYYTSGVTGEPGDTLEYVIGISNASGQAALDVVISDPIPQFTTYVSPTMRVDDVGDGWDAAIADGDNDTDAGEVGGGSVYIYAGTGGTDAPAGLNNGTGGSLADGITTYGAFQVTID